MARPPVLRGELPGQGPAALLRELEIKRITGELRFSSGDTKGAIHLFGGEIAEEQPAVDGSDPVDVLLTLESGEYEVHQRLPPLPVSRGNDYAKNGTLAVHVPADLMGYCEHAGLTGTLELRSGERHAEAIYEAGELLAIELDGRDDGDLTEVFGWEHGQFRVTLDTSAPSRVGLDIPIDVEETQPPVRRQLDTKQFLRVVEMTLVDVIEKSERARSPTRTSPPLPPPPKARPRQEALRERRTRRTETVRLIYLGGEARVIDASEEPTRDGNGAQANLADAHPEPDDMAKKKKKRPKQATGEPAARAPAKEASAGAPEKPAPAKAVAPVVVTAPVLEEISPRERISAGLSGEMARPLDPDVPTNPWAALGWTLVLVVIGFLILFVLAHLFPSNPAQTGPGVQRIEVPLDATRWA